MIRKLDEGQKEKKLCVIVAAGRSSRMGSFKPLLYWPGSEKTIIGTVLSKAIMAGLSPIVIAGYKADELSTALKDYCLADFLINKDWEKGMLGSIKLGLQRALELNTNNKGCFISLGDMPLLPSKTYELMLNFISQVQDDICLFPRYKNHLGHPVWVPFTLFSEIFKLVPETKLRSYLLEQPWTALDMDYEEILIDIDTKKDYEEAMLKAGH